MQTVKTSSASMSYGWRLSCSAFAVAVMYTMLSPASVFAQGDDKDKGTVIEINDAIISGTGCKAGLSKIYTFQSQGPGTPIDSFLTEHENFSAGRLQERNRNRTYCNTALKIELPEHPDKTKSYQFSVNAVRHSGHLDLLDGVEAVISTRMEMRIVNGMKISASQSTKGPFSGDFNYKFDKFFDENGKEQVFYSVCGREPTFNIHTSLKLIGDGDRKNSSVILDQVESDDKDQRARFAQDFRLTWRECDLPTEDQEDGGR